VKFHPGSKIDPARLMELVSSVEGAQFTPAGVLRLPIRAAGESPSAILGALRSAFSTLCGPDAEPSGEPAAIAGNAEKAGLGEA
jgi:hypothetical protein